MFWVAFDRAVKSCDHWRTIRDAIHGDICARGYDADRNTFVQYYGGQTLDAALLLISQVGFIPVDNPRVAGTVAAIEHDLLRNGFVTRSSTDHVDDSVGGEDGAPAINPQPGLLAEDYDPVRKCLVGNFPQGF